MQEFICFLVDFYEKVNVQNMDNAELYVGMCFHHIPEAINLIFFEIYLLRKNGFDDIMVE